ncbi:hypothetical protein EV359DRAFT_77506 [Lentinula novae-zelandiae]|nr:hypothetical protein EV359DRAFT_77506 [Lentinula novae-zelandiae]
MLHAKKSGIKTIPGDIFEAGLAPSETVTNHLHFPQKRIVLVHACNTVGSLGAGIALAFKDRYPEQYELYRESHLVVEYERQELQEANMMVGD